MDKQVFHNILNTLDTYKQSNFDLIQSVQVLEMLIKKQNFDLKNCGGSGIVLFGSNKSFSKLLKENYKDINKDKVQTIFKKLEDNNLIWRLTRQLQEKVTVDKKERIGFATAIFILPTYKEFQAELYNKLKKANTYRELDQIIARMLYIANAGFNDQELKDKVLVARNYKDKAYKDNVRNNLIDIWNVINNKKVLRHRKDKKVVKIEQLEYKDKGKVKLLH
jgi:hypothetical protein